MKMSATVFCSAIVVCALGFAIAAGTPQITNVKNTTEVAAKPGDSKVREFMRGKLKASENILEGLVTEDYKMIQKGGEKLVLMSKAADWQVIQGPTYAQYSTEFRRNADQLAKMGKKKQLDSAALSYMQVTMTCINCHKYVKNAKVAQGEPLSPRFQLTLHQDHELMKRLKK